MLSLHCMFIKYDAFNLAGPSVVMSGFIMTSSNGKVFRVTGHLCREFTGPRWIPRTKTRDAELRCYLWSAPWINGWVNNREAGDLRHNNPNYDVILMSLTICGEKPQIIFGLLLQRAIIVRRAGLLWSQQDFEWRWSAPLFKCLTVLEFSFILFDLCLLITFFNFIMNYVPIVTFWIFTYHKIWILSIMFCFIWSYWIIYFLACLEVSWRVVS